MDIVQLPAIDMRNYRYDLPEARIAKYPLPQRDQSRLLVFQAGAIRHQLFSGLPELLDGSETLFINNTKVIPARLFFRKDTGGLIEIFLLRPLEPHLVEMAMRAYNATTWECVVGNLKKWPENMALEREITLENQAVWVKAYLADRQKMTVRFEWDDPEVPFVKIVEAGGVVPIPPYLNRPSEDADKSSYQTVYSKKEGAVAAPTAGLHFTPAVLESIRQKGVRMEELTLHVSAGTFRPVKAENALDHDMHSEQVVVSRQNLEALASGRPVVAVGTTSMRTLESVYWFGVKLLMDENAEFSIEKLYPYQHRERDLPSLQESVRAVLACMDRRGWTELYGDTEIFIFPGYTFRVCDRLITNFHQPSSTLLLLVAAFTGGDNWKQIYQAALVNGYRFLSYGDSSLLYKNETGR